MAALETKETSSPVVTAADKSTEAPVTVAEATSPSTQTSAEATTLEPAETEVALVTGEQQISATEAAPTANALTSESKPSESGGIFSRLFGNRPTPSEPIPAAELQPQKVQVASLGASPIPTRAADTTEPTRPRTQKTERLSSLPGVDRDRALGAIEQKTDAEGRRPTIRINRGNEVRLASVGGLARLTPNGLLKQHAGVDVKCLKPALLKLLKRVENKYGEKVIVTSGYRSPARNRRARGARNSLHMYCAAADIQVKGVSKWKLASYLRSLPGRGGVGTYCHTKSVHIDIGPRRDWNARCRR
ncbi:MAG: D-Ala-D-Ala carboxypeptidase family metallohydrolase [Pseudomonadota bacterium]